MRCAIITLIFSLSAAWAEPKATPRPRVVNAQNLAIWQAEALQSHPSVAAARARAEATTAAIGAVRLWEDPQLGLGLTGARRVMRKEDGDIRVGAEQMLPRRGLYDAEVRRATAAQRAQAAMLRQTANDLGLSVAQAVLELALADDLIEFQAENLTWLETVVKTALERAKNPDGTATETLRLESELAVRRQTLASLQRRRAQFGTTLNLLLGRAADSPWSVLTLQGQAPFAGGVASLLARMERDNPQLAALRHQIDGARAEAEAAREKTKPAFSVGVETNTYSGGDFRGGMVSLRMTLPWFNRAAYRADVARADYLHAAAQSDAAAEQRALYTRLTAFLTEANNQQQLATAYAGDVLPRSEKTVETLQSAWVSSKATLLEVLEARRALLDARQEQKRALAARDAAFQNLTAITGGFMPAPSK